MWWISKPEEVEAKITEWINRHQDLLRLEFVTQFTGHRVYALTVTDKSIRDESKVRCIFAVPHAHEPAGTAASIDVINQLLTGVNLRGEPTDIDREEALRRLILTFIPVANPYGMERSPERWWDGTKYTNEEFLNIAFGVDQDGKRFHRYGRWCSLEHKPMRIGIVYEKVWHHTYVEPNRDWSSSYFKLLFKLLPEHKTNLLLDLHQTEFERSPYNAEVILPTLQDELPREIRRYNEEWGVKLVDALEKAGGMCKPEPRPLGYIGEQREYFVKYSGFIMRSIPMLTVEVQNNNERTPPRRQLELHEAVIKATIDRLTEDGEKPPSRPFKDPQTIDYQV